MRATTILAFDTSHEKLDVSLSFLDGNGNPQVVTYFEEIGLHHSEHLLPTVESLLLNSGLTIRDVDLVVANRGPGSFTGLRIGLATAKGISCATGIPCVSIPAHDLYAFIHRTSSAPVLVVIDAKKQRFYSALVKEGKTMTPVYDASIEELQQVAAPYAHLQLSGPHAQICFDRWAPLHTETTTVPSLTIAQEASQPITPSMIMLGLSWYRDNGADTADTGPIYVRKSEAEINLLQRRDSLS